MGAARSKAAPCINSRFCVHIESDLFQSLNLFPLQLLNSQDKLIEFGIYKSDYQRVAVLCRVEMSANRQTHLPRGRKEVTMRKIFIITALLPLLAISLSAQVTSKISGRVIDSQTGEPLPGANVFIKGTTMGAASDPDGYYFIINIPVGGWTVMATMMGYEPFTVTKVRVSAGLTTTLNFELRSTVIEVEGVTVTAERPLVIPDATATMHITTAEDIARQPVQTYQAVIEQQAGVIQTTGGVSGVTDGIHIRGGRGDEIAFMVDGMPATDRLTARAGASIDINLNAVEEISVTTGGFNAEFGQAMSGVVNVITKEGGPKLEGMVRYTTDQIFDEDIYLNEGRHRFEVALGGPIPYLRGMNWFFSGEVNNRERLSRYFPIREEEDFLSNSDREFYSLQGKLSYKFNPNMKLHISSFLSRAQGGNYGTYAGLPGMTDMTQGRDEQSDRYKPPYFRRSNFKKSYQLQATLTHSLSPTTFYKLQFGRFYTRSIPVAHIDPTLEEDRPWWEDIEMRPWWTYGEDQSPTADAQGFYAKDENGDYYYPHGVPGAGFQFGSPGWWSAREFSYNGGKFDITSQLGPHHLLKGGFEVRMNDVHRESGQYINSISSVVYSVGDTVWRWYEKDSSMYIIQPRWPGDTGTVEWVDPASACSLEDIKNALYWDFYDVKPMEGVFYIQDKMEYSGFVVNLGLRADYFDPAHWSFRDPAQTHNPDGSLDTLEADSKWQISPRFGISFPVTDMTAFHLAYGHFFQMPILIRLYDGANNPLFRKRGGWGLIGNPDLESEKTIQYEIGISHQITDNTALYVTTFYKDLYNLVASRFIPAVPDPYTSYVTEDYGNVKGIEFTFRMRALKGLSGQLSYTLQEARGTGSYDREAYYDYIANIPVDPYTGQPYILPRTDYPLEFDIRHSLTFNLDYYIPIGEGPTLGEYRPLGGFGVNLLANFEGGSPYTKRTDVGRVLGVVNAERMPSKWDVDLSLTKDFGIYGVDLSFFLEITNLLNARNPEVVYPNTGLVDENNFVLDRITYLDQTFPSIYRATGKIPVGGLADGSADERRDLDEDGFIDMDEWYESYYNASTDYIDDSQMVCNPRHINFGISLKF